MGGASREARGVFHCPDKQRLKLFRAASPAWANLCRSARDVGSSTKSSNQRVPDRLSSSAFPVRMTTQGNRLEVLWDYELDRLILEEEGWADLASKGFED